MATVDQVGQRFPFDVDFQKALLRLMTEDQTFGVAAMEHLKPEFFETEILGWIFRYMQEFHGEHAVIPSMAAVMQQTSKIDATIRQLYISMTDEIRQCSLRDEAWLRDAVLDFVRRNVFVRAFQEGRELYNNGKPDKAYDLMMEQMEDLSRIMWEPIDEEWHYQELQRRHSERVLKTNDSDAIPTGFPSLDHILRGGLHAGELGIFLAYPKTGKSTTLVTFGVNATRRHYKVLHIVLEGSRSLIATRYDSAFTREAYSEVKSGQMNPGQYALALKEYQYFRETLVLRSFVDKWEVNVLDIDQCLRRLHRNYGWRPHQIIIDYADLMTGRDKKYYRTETESQRAAYRDVKRLSSRGYAVWTVSQATRPSTKDMEKEHILYSNSVADTYEKVRAADFLGSLNQTPDEKSLNTMRMFLEMYRDNASMAKPIQIVANWENMQMYENSTLAPQQPSTQNQSPGLGYIQTRAPM